MEGGLCSHGQGGVGSPDSDDVPCLPEAHLPHLAAPAAAHSPQVLQVVDLRLVALGKESQGWGSSRPLPSPLAHISQLCRAHPPWGHQGKCVRLPGPRWSGSRSGFMIPLQLLVNLLLLSEEGVPVEGVLTNVRLPQPPTCRGFHRAHQCHPEAGPARPDLPTIHQEAHLSMLRGVNKADGSPSMWRGRAGGRGVLRGALGGRRSGCPHRWAAGAAGLGGGENQVGGVSSWLAPTAGPGAPILPSLVSLRWPAQPPSPGRHGARPILDHSRVLSPSPHDWEGLAVGWWGRVVPVEAEGSPQVFPDRERRP